MQHVPDGTCLFTRHRMLAGSPLPLGFRRRVVYGHVLAEHLLVTDDSASPGKAPGGERAAELFAHAVPSISQHDAECHTLCSHAVEFFQGEIALRLVHLEVLRHACQAATLWIVSPALGEEQPHPERREHALIGEGEGNESLAVGEFSERTTVLVSDADAVLATLRQGSVINDQHAVLTTTQGLSAFSEQAFERVRVPRADVQEVVEALIRQPEVLGDGFSALPFQWSEEAADVSGEASALLGVVKGFQTGRQKVGERPLPIVWDRHTYKDRSPQQGAAERRPRVTKSCYRF